VPTDNLLFGYFGPEVILPVTSIVATVAGVAMMLGRGSYRYMIDLFHRARQRIQRARGPAAMSRPHFHVRDESRTEATRE
jgi:hypothetical protein